MKNPLEGLFGRKPIKAKEGGLRPSGEQLRKRVLDDFAQNTPIAESLRTEMTERVDRRTHGQFPGVEGETDYLVYRHYDHATSYFHSGMAALEKARATMVPVVILKGSENDVVVSVTPTMTEEDVFSAIENRPR